MSGCFPIIVLVQFVAVLVLISHAEALECYETRETCDKLTCLNNEPESPATPQAEPCKRPEEIVMEDITTAVKSIGADLLSSAGSDAAEIPLLAPEFLSLRSALEAKVKDAENSAANQSLCIMGQAVFTIKLTSSTIQKSHVLRACATGVPRCQDIKETSSGGKIEVIMKLCLTDGDKSNGLSAKLDIDDDGRRSLEGGFGQGSSGAKEVYLSLLVGTVLLTLH